MSPCLSLFLREPRSADQWSHLPADGVGLVRLDEILVDEVRVHPLAVLRSPLHSNPVVRRTVDELSEGHRDPVGYFIDTVASRLKRIAALYEPRPVVVRFSDLNSHEYAQLIGGSLFEPHEQRAELGLRGASRYVSKLYRPAFELECAALRAARRSHSNLGALIPFCRTLDEADEVLNIMRDSGLQRGLDGFRIHVMVELPANVEMIRDLADRFDGLSIGTGDLARLVLGQAPADSALPPTEWNSEPLRRTIARILKAAADLEVSTNLCGPGARNDQLVRFAIDHGVDEITVLPQDFEHTAEQIRRTS